MGIKSLWKFEKTLQKGQLVAFEGILRHHEVEIVIGATFKPRIAEIHAVRIRRLSKVEAGDHRTGGGRRRVVTGFDG
jgi:single-strand DNA-binding protein